MTEDELFEDVRYWKGRADAAEVEMCEARELGGKYLLELSRLRSALQEIVANAENGEWTLPSSFAARARTALSRPVLSSTENVGGGQ